MTFIGTIKKLFGIIASIFPFIYNKIGQTLFFTKKNGKPLLPVTLADVDKTIQSEVEYDNSWKDWGKEEVPPQKVDCCLKKTLPEEIRPQEVNYLEAPLQEVPSQEVTHFEDVPPQEVAHFEDVPLQEVAYFEAVPLQQEVSYFKETSPQKFDYFSGMMPTISKPKTISVGRRDEEVVKRSNRLVTDFQYPALNQGPELGFMEESVEANWDIEDVDIRQIDKETRMLEREQKKLDRINNKITKQKSGLAATKLC